MNGKEYMVDRASPLWKGSRESTGKFSSGLFGQKALDLYERDAVYLVQRFLSETNKNICNRYYVKTYLYCISRSRMTYS